MTFLNLTLPRLRGYFTRSNEDGLDSEQLLDLHGHPCTGAGRPRCRIVRGQKKPGQLIDRR